MPVWFLLCVFMGFKIKIDKAHNSRMFVERRNSRWMRMFAMLELDPFDKGGRGYSCIFFNFLYIIDDSVYVFNVKSVGNISLRCPLFRRCHDEEKKRPVQCMYRYIR